MRFSFCFFARFHILISGTVLLAERKICDVTAVQCLSVISGTKEKFETTYIRRSMLRNQVIDISDKENCIHNIKKNGNRSRMFEK